jgi:hypothetical protein
MFSLKIGYCLIGSLYWDDGENNLRREWRKEHLLINEAVYCKVPIRYGRQSKNDHYTMVLSNEFLEANKFGKAYVVPHSKVIESKTELYEAIGNLSNAEGRSNKLSLEQNASIIKGIKNNWGIVSYVISPQISNDKRRLLEDFYQEQLRKFGKNFTSIDYSIADEKSLLNIDGSNNLDWLEAVLVEDQIKIDYLDIIFITFTKQNIKSYPKGSDLYRSLNEDPRKYIYNNMRVGISTHQDNEIIE